jgi:hypothetical protein
MDNEDKPAAALGTVESKWGTTDAAHFGYASEDERKAKRGLEDWEIVDKIPESQKPVPYWFFAVVLVVLLVGVGLSFPFWGLRPGDNHPWLDWGYLVALVYISVAGTFVWFMVRLFASGASARPGAQNAKEKREDDR